MSNPVVQAFFVGRALAEVLSEKAEESLSTALSELGKFDAQQRELFREFTQEVMARAQQQAGDTNDSNSSEASNEFTSTTKPADLQETIDELRAEIARLRSELKQYQNESN